MSLTSSTSGITFGGIASGLDTEGIITKLISIEKAGIPALTTHLNQLNQKATLYGNFKTTISGVAQAVNALSASDAFQAVGLSVTDPSVISVTTSSGAQPGSYNFKVSKLAQAQKISSAPQASTTAALGQAGQFVVNGKVVSVDVTDTLASIAAKVNALNNGVSAGVINGGAGQAFLTFTSSQTGLVNKAEISDLTGSTLSSIGIIGGASTVRQSIPNGASSFSLSSTSTPVGNVIGASGLSPQTIQINGTNVSIDLSTDNLQNIADKINTASAGANASVVTTVTNGVSKYSLSITGTSGTPTFTDAGNTLAALGILQQGSSHELIQAQDAAYTIDNVALTSATNTITNVVAGTTITLLKADATTPSPTTLNLSNDAGAVAAKVKGVMTAVNQTFDFINQNSQFDATTYATGPLFGDSIAQQFRSSVNSTLMSNVPGLQGTYKNLIDIGFSLDSSGNMAVDDTKLQAAITADPSSVKQIFQNFGTSTSGNLAYVSSTSSTKTSSIVPYDVNVTQVATKTQYIAATAKTGPNTVSEKLTFGGSMFANGNMDLTVDIGSNLSDIVSKINNDPRLKDFVIASENGGKLEVDSTKYGKNGQFTLVSNQSPLGTNSGVGFAAGTLNNGLDVMGTIAGQSATGVGQYLTGDTTNTVAGGMQVQYSGTTTGPVGSINFTSGLIGVLNNTLNTFTDFTTGETVTGAKSLTDQAAAIQTQIDAINKRATDKATELRSNFSVMEQKIQQLQSQGNQLATLLTSTVKTA
jgi:flagellar hook-associated protein 2